MMEPLRLKVAMAIRVRDFLKANPFGESPADQVAARFVERVGRAQALLTQKEAGAVASKASTRHRKALRKAMNVPLRHVGRIGKAVAADFPGVVSGFPRPALGRSEPDFLASVRAIVQEVEGQKALFLEHGLAAESLEELTRLMGEFERSMEDANAGRRSHTGAHAELRVVVRQLMRMAQQLDGIALYRYRAQPELMGAWTSARNVAWPVPVPVKEAGEEKAPGSAA